MSTLGKALPSPPVNQDQSFHPPEAVLPPLTRQYPQWCCRGRLGAAKYPHTSYSERFPTEQQETTTIKKVQDGLPNSKEDSPKDDDHSSESADPKQRVFQLERNIQHIQEQHEIMLQGLHEEVEKLKMKNKELQFQLVMGGGQAPVTLLQNIPPSPEDEAGPRVLLSPKQLNMSPLQIEILENEIKELQSSLHESRSRNVYLQNLLEEQKKKLQENVADKGRIPEPVFERNAKVENVGAGSERKGEVASLALISRTPTLPTYGTKLEEAEKVIKQLRQENEEHKKEILKIKSNLNKTLNVRHQARNSGNHRSKGESGHRVQHVEVHPLQQRFPPLRSQNYKQNRSMTEFPPVVGGNVFHPHGMDKLGPFSSLDPAGTTTHALPALCNSSQMFQGGNKKGHSGNNSSWGGKYHKERDLKRLPEHRDRDYSRFPENGDRRHRGRNGDK